MFWFIAIFVVIIVAVAMYSSHHKKRDDKIRQRVMEQCTALRKLGAKCELCDIHIGFMKQGMRPCNHELLPAYDGICTNYVGSIIPNKACRKCGSTDAMYFSRSFGRCVNCNETHALSELE